MHRTLCSNAGVKNPDLVSEKVLFLYYQVVLFSYWFLVKFFLCIFVCILSISCLVLMLYLQVSYGFVWVVDLAFFGSSIL